MILTISPRAEARELLLLFLSKQCDPDTVFRPPIAAEDHKKGKTQAYRCKRRPQSVIPQCVPPNEQRIGLLAREFLLSELEAVSKPSHLINKVSGGLYHIIRGADTSLDNNHRGHRDVIASSSMVKTDKKRSLLRTKNSTAPNAKRPRRIRKQSRPLHLDIKRGGVVGGI